ncbi:hypothetical protein L6Q96_19820 [Candidatus Binatia bacterium]|nr:hypothetical protein [Candidatus Binatia bacterium]
MSAGGPEGGRAPLRCSHCGRHVAGTTHTRTTYRVDYYALHTGEVEPVLVQRPDDPDRTVTVLRLVRPIDVYTCVDCYAQPAVRVERERRFRPEVAGEATPVAAGS